MKTYYAPTPPGGELSSWVFRELQRVAAATQQDNLLTKRTVAPTAPQDGQVEYADGTGWQPADLFWDDLRFPATSINPPGAASDPDVDTTNGTLLFAPSGTEVIFLIAQMPHSWAEGTTVVPHVHWYKTTSAAGAVMWQFEYKKFQIGVVGDAAFTALTASVPTVSDNDTAFSHALTSFGDLDMSDMGISDMLVMKLSRLGSDAADTYGADVALLEFDIHYQIDSSGSVQQFTKTPTSPGIYAYYASAWHKLG